MISPSLGFLNIFSGDFRLYRLRPFREANDADQAKPLCLLTFDDGWRDTYATAYPWLKRFGMPATVFIATGSIERRGGFWVEQLR